MVHPWLLAKATRASRRSRVDPEELAASALSQIFLSSRSFRFRGSAAFRGWLAIIVCNMVRKSCRPEPVPHYPIDGRAEPEDPSLREPASILSAREAAETARRAWILLAALATEEAVSRSAPGARNRPLDRRLLDWHHCHGLSFREIGRRLDRKPGQIAGMVRRARDRLFAHLVRILAPCA